MKWLQSDHPGIGSVLFSGKLPPRSDEFGFLQRAGVTIKPARQTSDAHWNLTLNHPEWGEADLICLKNLPPVTEALTFTQNLSSGEAEAAQTAKTSVCLRVPAKRKTVLLDRKNLLRYFRAVMTDDAVAAVDHGSHITWSRAMLDDELAHDAPLDIESLYCIHAVGDESGERASWIHTHGLAELGAFDLDFVRPVRLAEHGVTDAIRALAFAALERTVEPDQDRFALARPNGDIRLVTAEAYMRDAAAADRAPREMDDDSHRHRRSVVCEPVRGVLGRLSSRPRPSRFFEHTMGENSVFAFSMSATDLMSERARGTVTILRAYAQEVAEFEFPVLVKLGYPTTDGGREHLWFQVHHFVGDQADATLLNQPYGVPTLKQEQRGRHPLELLSDWTISTPAGQITPRNASPIRAIREHIDELRVARDSGEE